MNKIRIFSAIIIFSIMAASRSTTTIQKSQPQIQQPVNTATPTPKKPAQQNNTATPEAPTNTATPQPTNTQTPVASCPTVDGYVWSEVFLVETSFIHTILPAADGNYIIGGVLDDDGGTWVAKVDPNGKLIWQKQFSPSGAILKPAPNGNFVLQYRTRSVELDSDGNVVFSVQASGMRPNADGSHTVLGEEQIVRFNDPADVQWGIDFVDFEMYGDPTTDGGAIYAYAGSYVDKSVYYAPFYTDIKVIKVDGNGQVWQRVYGVLTGTENLDFVLPTDDGGAILAGTHSYSDLGSDFDIWLMKVNSTGSLSWQTTLKQAPNSEPVTNLYLLSNGLLLVSEDYYSNDMQLVYLGKNGALVWQNRVNSVRGRISIQAAANTADGGLVVAGQTEEMTNVSFLARFDAKGKLSWEKLTGFYNVENSPNTFVESILPLQDGNILVGGGSNVLGQGLSDQYGAWLASIADEGEAQGLLTIMPGTFSAIKTISGRPKTLPDVAFEPGSMPIQTVDQPVTSTSFQSIPACIAANASYPTPQALPSLTPSMTPTPSQVRDLYWTSPAMQGDDVLMLQQRLLELGYEEVGEPDGIFGKMTQSAVIAFQQNNHLEVDGYVGWKTWHQLFSKDAKGK